MTRLELERLVRDAECHPQLRHHLARCGSWQELLRAARAQGYAVRPHDLQQASREARAGTFLQRARLRPIPPLLAGTSSDQSWRRRSASTAR